MTSHSLHAGYAPPYAPVEAVPTDAFWLLPASAALFVVVMFVMYAVVVRNNRRRAQRNGPADHDA